MSRWTRLQRLYRQQGGICWVCGLPMTLPAKRYEAHRHPMAYEATIDHLEPRGRDLHQPVKLYRVTTRARPARAAHRTCNNARHHYPLDHPRVREHVKLLQLRFTSPAFRRSLGLSE